MILLFPHAGYMYLPTHLPFQFNFAENIGVLLYVTFSIFLLLHLP
jgi:hypothetical protein